MVFLIEFFEKVDFEKKQTKSMKNFPGGKELTFRIYWPAHEILVLITSANIYDTDKPAHSCSLARGFAACINTKY